jgi:hypothetical protein
MQTVTDARALAHLAADFPGWHVWRSRDGRGNEAGWHATLRRKLTSAEGAEGMLARLAAQDAAALRAQLGQQQAIRERQERAA